MEESEPQIFRWFLDASHAFPYPPEISPGHQRLTTRAWSETAPVSRALSLLSEEEQTKVLRYHFPRDAALSLASCLLKRLAVVRACGVSWASAEIMAERDVQNGKPYYKPGGVEFNVSHHGELVVLVATTTASLHVGVDLVRTNLERDIKNVEENSFDQWVRIFTEVLSEEEIRVILSTVTFSDQRSTGSLALKPGFRMFYAHWALKEAYFKMTGDGLLSTSLRELRFSEVEPPQAPELEDTQGSWIFGQITLAQASLHRKAIEDLTLELVALSDSYMIATAISAREAVLPAFREVLFTQDILPMAEDISSIAGRTMN